MTFSAFRDTLTAAGAQPIHADRILRRWLRGQDQLGGRRPATAWYPARLLAALPAFEQRLDALAQVHSVHPGDDGSERLLVALADGQQVETVLLLREGLCISSQVGCAVGCVFCRTGQDGLLRQLTSAELVAQVAVARRRRAVQKVVFMGMGEPSHNLEAVLEAIDVLGTLGGIGHKELVFSTVGDPRVFERLGQARVRPALAVSLHTTRDALRRELLPRAPRLSPEELVAAADDYAQATGYPVQYQWTLLEGINDGDDELEGVARLLAGRRGLLNLIPFNAVDGLDFRRPAPERAEQMAQWLQARGIRTTVRRSAGQDVDAGCGQLRARASRPVVLRRGAATSGLASPPAAA